MTMYRNLLFRFAIASRPSFIGSQNTWPRVNPMRCFHSSFVLGTKLSESLKVLFQGRIDESIASDFVFMRMEEERKNKLSLCNLHQAISKAREMGDHAVLKVANPSEKVEHPICVYAPYDLLAKMRGEKTSQEIKVRKAKHESKTRLRYVLLSWRIDKNDLERKLKGAEKFLQNGLMVEIHVQNKRNTPPVSPEQKKTVLSTIRSRLDPVGKTSKPPQLSNRSATFYYECVDKN
ncbi:translation initiation factor [Schizosaccharomyces cryophilus OY26]|uniref:Translation initiation factor n=1 Tax=Schizosaccharomyces cryophilus (strain OY26 / ATCC MYA-4695 / CBS 11777 / NBRC 106824 / NRRL Y48691) TaxID=653667 RepID=S9VU27_SCHCR|nr:translation initiation factor [Schizosaccharomyces cryophilus OY26]EPY49610.1 translation initiation factor [Schizosaccharomyces cryophilus OY26]